MALAQTGSENTNVIGTQLDSYVTSLNSPVIPERLNTKYNSVGDGFCVAFIKSNGFEDYRGNARDWIKYVDPSAIGWPGDAILLNEGGYYKHLALIIGNSGGYQLVEQNYIGIYIISYRTIPYDYPLIEGIIPRPI